MPKMVQVRGVPDDVHDRLRQRARAAGMSLSDFALQELTRLSDRPSLAELLDRIAADGGEPISLREARDAVVGERPQQ